MTPLLALLAFLAGVFAVLATPREEEPQIDVTLADIFIPFPGASARDVENRVARPAEQALARIAGIEHVYSVSRPGMAVVTAQFEVGEDPVRALVRLYDTVSSQRDRIAPGIGVGEPVVKPKSIDDVPVVTLTFWTRDPERAAFEMQQVARAIESEIKRIPGTRDVTTLGGPGHVIRVAMDAERMAAHGVTASDIKAALQLSNVMAPSGSLVAGNQELLVETGAYLETAADVKRLVVGVDAEVGTSVGVGAGRPVFMADVARIDDGPARPAQYVWHGSRDGIFPAVTLSVTKQPGVNAADVARAVIARAGELRGAVIPEGVAFTVTRDYGATATDKARQLIGKLVFATAAVVLLVLFALGRREAVIVGVAVTLTLAATLFASWAWGFTLNRVSLFALIFSIGILVDDAIVVVENIHRRWQLTPDASLRAIIPQAVDEVGGPTILATFTVVAALLPMAFVTGLMGPYMSPIPINASMGMFISLAVAFVVTPWLALKLLGRTHAPALPAVGEKTLAQGRLAGFFRRLMTPFLTRKAARRMLWLGLLVAIAASVSLALTERVVLKMLPFDNKSEFQIVLDMPVGTPLEETASVLREIGAEIAQVDEVTDYQIYAGLASPINFNGLVRQYYLRAASELGDIQVNLIGKQHRRRDSHAITTAVRDTVAAIATRRGGNAKVVEVPPGPPVLSPIVAEIYGPDYAGQIAAAKAVRQVFERTADIVGVDDSVQADVRKIVLHVAQNKAALMGVAQQDIVEAVRLGLAGEDITPVHSRAAKYEIPVRVTLAPEQQHALDPLLKLTVRARDGRMVPVSELVEAREAPREKAIYHKDLLPVVYVVGDMGGALDSPLYGMFDIRGKVKGMTLAQGGALGDYFIRQPQDPYTGYALKWDGEWQVTYETFRDMGLAYAVGLILIYLLAVAQFKSYLAPLIIMAPIPLTIIGVLPGHALLGSQFTATSMIGMIALAGIIVRNSILLVDFINAQAASGMDFAEAVIQASIVRARPIGLTGLAAMIGAVFILDDPIFNGLAVSLIFGIFVSTLLTLVVIPVLYYAVMKGRTPEHGAPSPGG
ncbi:MAG: efflux RND transporter permease subunit [Zoogloeaceae bacterium]|nr:efflux RND transporter permease subunit [Zoogloeaceae bacterium]